MELQLHAAPPLIIEKINTLCSLLSLHKKRYEDISARIPDKELRRTILTLAQETNQYAVELYAHMETLGGIARMEILNQWEAAAAVVNLNLQDEIKILDFCEQNEKEMVRAYREILNESFLYEGLRKMIRYQLNGILCSFTQLKLLNSLKVSRPVRIR